MSASHIIQAGHDLFIGKDEAYIMNRKKKEKSMLTPVEVDAINQAADGRERGMRVTFDCNSSTF